MTGDTIAAIATAPGRGGVAVIRVSGPEAFGIAERLRGQRSEVKGQRSGQEWPRVRFCRLYHPLTSDLRPLTFLDEAVVLAFRAPHSYTGEDVVEFQCHGGAVTPRRVLEACIAAGARLARRGEFTERAFLNGKLDYGQAESVLDLIDAKTARAADAALEGLSGCRRRELKALYEAALDLSTRIEHALDVDENELPVGFADEIRAKREELRAEMEAALRRAAEGRILNRGALVVLAGPPNAGKSSLMNALLEESRAIVSDVPGTTRDSIEEWLDLDGWPIRLVDTAGLRETKDEIEAEGVRRSEELMAKADVVLMLNGGEVERWRSEEVERWRSGEVEKWRSGEDLTTAPLHHSTPPPLHHSISPLLPLTSKCDLGRGPGLNVSAKTGEGLEDLKRAIVAKLEQRVVAADAGDSTEADVAVYHEVLSVLDGAGGGRETEEARRGEDLVLEANAVRRAAERLGEAIGATYSSDLLDNLFSRFCVGK